MITNASAISWARPRMQAVERPEMIEVLKDQAEAMQSAYNE